MKDKQIIRSAKEHFEGFASINDIPKEEEERFKHLLDEIVEDLRECPNCSSDTTFRINDHQIACKDCNWKGDD